MRVKILSKISFAFNQIGKGNLGVIFRAVIQKIYSKRTSIGLKLDLTKELAKPISFVKLSVREFTEEDEKYFKEDNENTTLIKQLPKCYVAITEDGEPCFRQWTIDASHNKKIQEFWSNTYPVLKEGEALMESAFTVPKLRGMGVMPLAIFKVAEQCKTDGLKTIITFAPLTHINSIRSLNFAGFKPYCVVEERHLLFIKTVRYKNLTPEMTNKYYELTKRRRNRKKVN